MLDPGYWKQQYFLIATLKKLLPTNRPQLCALQLAPGDAKHIGYLSPDKDAQGIRLDRFIALGKVGADLQDMLEKQGDIFKVAVEFRPWRAGAEAPGLRQDSVDVALLAAGTTAGLGSDLPAGLGEVRRALRSDGRVLIVANEEDEMALGGKMEVILEAQNLRELSELEDVKLDEGEGEAGEVFRRAGLMLLRVLRDECGLAVGICVRREQGAVEEKVPGARRMRRQAAAAAQKPQQLQRGGPSLPKGGAPPRPKR